MKNILFALALVAGGLTFGSVASANEAECVKHTACDAARIQSNLPEVPGPQAPTTGNMVCVHAVAYEPTELVLADGDQPVGQAVEGDVITKWRVQESQWKRWPLDNRYVYREICFHEALLHVDNDPTKPFREALTLCNGIYLDQPLRNRSVWRTSKGVPAYISRVGRVEFDDAACLLGSAECANFGL